MNEIFPFIIGQMDFVHRGFRSSVILNEIFPLFSGYLNSFILVTPKGGVFR